MATVMASEFVLVPQITLVPQMTLKPLFVLVPLVGSVYELYDGKTLYAVFMSRAFTWSGVSKGILLQQQRNRSAHHRGGHAGAAQTIVGGRSVAVVGSGVVRNRN